jgi:hypothetical protein
MDTRDFHKINEAYMTLIPKTSEAKIIKDYRPILLSSASSSKVLANRLSSKLHDLVHMGQSAFPRGRFIQNNFRMIHSNIGVGEPGITTQETIYGYNFNTGVYI